MRAGAGRAYDINRRLRRCCRSICGPIIPPSVAMILYALAAGNVSIGGLFMAGAAPGVLLGLGVLGPPVGVVLFMTCALVDIRMETLSRAIVPFVAWMMVVVALLIAAPSLTLFLPGLVGFR